MSDPFKKVKEGDPLDLSAAAWNGFIDAAQDYKQRKQNIGESGATEVPGDLTVLVRNDTKNARDRFDILYLRDMVFKPTDGNGKIDDEQFLDEPVFTGTVRYYYPPPESTEEELPAVATFAVLTEPLDPGEIGRALIGGLATVRIDFTPEYVKEFEHWATRAYPKEDLTGFLPGYGGSRVLWTEEKDGVCWAVILLGTTILSGGGGGSGSFARITGNSLVVGMGSMPGNYASGVYPSWEEVALDSDNGWKTIRQPEGFKAGPLVEANGLDDVPIGSIVHITPTFSGLLPIEDLLNNPTFPYAAFEFTVRDTVGFGIPVAGEAGNWAGQTAIMLTKTDELGEPLTGDNGGTVTVDYNARGIAGGFKYQPYTDSDILTYVPYQEPRGAVGGCLFGPIVGPKMSTSITPLGGRAVHGSEAAPITKDVTGRDDQTDHVHVRGRMYIDDATGELAPWMVFDPEDIEKTDSVLVKTNDTDTTAGYLDDEIVVDPGGDQDFWLEKSITPGGNADNKLLLQHKEFGDHPGRAGWIRNLTAVEGCEILEKQGSPPDSPEGAISFVWEEWRQDFDDCGHTEFVHSPGWFKMLTIPGQAQVKVNAEDTTGGYLDNEIITADRWITKTITPGGAADNKLQLAHADWDSVATTSCGVMCGNFVVGNGASISATPPSSDPYLEFEQFLAEHDGKHHGRVMEIGDLIGGTYKRYLTLPSGLRVTTSDTTPGVLNDKLIVDPGGGNPFWLSKSVTSSGGNEKLLVEHKDYDSDNEDSEIMGLIKLEGFGGNCTVDIAEPGPGYAWIKVDLYRYKRDTKGHSELPPNSEASAPFWLKWPTMPVTPPGSGDHVLVANDGVLSWVELAEFECPEEIPE